MDSVKIGSFTFHIDNGGLLIIITTGDKEDKYRFDPKESVNLSDFLARHQHEFNAAIKSPEAVFPTVTRKQVEAWLEEAFHSGIPLQLRITLGNVQREDEWQGLDFSGTDLTGSHLAEANLSHCLFRDAHLQGVNLTLSHLQYCDLTGANLSEAQFDLAYFDHATLTRVVMIGCIGNRASFQEAGMKGANLRRSSLVGADFRGADLEGTDLSYCNLEGSEFGGTNLRHTLLTGANLTDCRFDGADLSEADLTGATATGSVITDRQTVWQPQNKGEITTIFEPPLDDLE